jgi:hypothetical protein
MYRFGVCDQLVFFDIDTNRWVCGTAFNNHKDGISADPASLDITDKSEPPLCGWEPNWIDADHSWGTCASDLFFAPKLAWDVLCTRAQRRKVEDTASIMDAFFVVSLL